MRTPRVSGFSLSLTGRFLLICIPLAFLASGALLVAYRQGAEETILATADEMSKTALTLLGNALWPDHGAFLQSPAAAAQTPDALDPRTQEILTTVAALARQSGVLKLKIYNREGMTVFSTAVEQIGQDYSEKERFRAAAAGGFSRQLLRRDRFLSLDGWREDMVLLGAYAPVWAAGPGSEVLAVIELYLDVAHLSDRVHTGLPAALVYGLTPLILLLTVFACLVVLRASERRTQIEFEKRLRVVDDARIARAADQAKTEFLANMSHELRTPLNAILGYAETIALQHFGPGEDARYRRYAGTILEAGRHLLAIVNDILDLSRVEAGKMPIHRQECDVAAMAQQVCTMLNQIAQEQQVHLVRSVQDDLPSLTTDGDKLRQSLINIVSNAIKFSEPGGTVRLSARATHDGIITIECRDDGIGMTMDQLQVALTPFGQVSDVYARKIQGAGLGLPLTKRFVEMIGGVFEIESRLDVGTTVRIRLTTDDATESVGAAA